MAKAKSLIESVKGELPDKRSGAASWHYNLRKENRRLMQDIDDLIDAWNAGDTAIRRVRQTKHSLAKRILQELPGIVTKPETIVRYITERANSGNQR